MKISSNSIQEKCCVSPGSQGMSIAWLITSQPDCSAEDKASSPEDPQLAQSTVTLLLACVTAQTNPDCSPCLLLPPQAVSCPVCSHSAWFYVYVQIRLDTKNLKGCSEPSTLQCNDRRAKHLGENHALSEQARTVE